VKQLTLGAGIICATVDMTIRLLGSAGTILGIPTGFHCDDIALNAFLHAQQSSSMDERK